jgi:hypothetical protein
MPIPDGYRKSEYTRGEVIGLIAPVVGCQPEDIADIVIICTDQIQMNVGVHTTFDCAIKEHWQTKAIGMMSLGIESLATAIHEQATPHGPKD